MGSKLLTGLGGTLVGIPAFLWEKRIEKSRQRVIKATGFMTRDHRRVHHFVVRELPCSGKPLSPEQVAGALSLPLERSVAILADLEKHLTFLTRDDRGRVLWAYPVTVEKTPHRITFGSGERLYAA